MENEILYLKLDDIIPNRFQPREVFDEEALEKLADSIKQHGVIEPIIVRPVSNKFEIIAGERRYKASVLAGLTKIPAIVKQLDDKESSIVAYIENEHRSDVSAIESARTIDRILKTNNMTQEELAKELGINQSTIANKIRLLNLPMEVQDALMHNEISERHARSLLSVKDEAQQIELLNRIKEKRMTVRELDGEIKKMNNSSNLDTNGFFNMGSTQSVGGNSNVGFNPGPMAPPQTQSNDFTSLFNNFDGSQPLPGSQEGKDSFLQPAPQDNQFLKFINEQTNPNTAPVAPASPVTPAAASNSNSDIVSFLNNYDKNYQMSSEPVAPVASEASVAPVTSVDQSTGNDVISFLNNYDSNYQMSNRASTDTPVAPVEEPKSAYNDFMDFYKSHTESAAPVTPVTPSAPVTPDVQPGGSEQSLGDSFMSFLKDYDSSNPVQTEEPVAPETPTTPAERYDSFMDSYRTEPAAPVAPASDGIMASSAVPPVVDANQYVEDNPNFVDVSKDVLIENADEIVNKVKGLVDEIKATSKIKIETDEIDFDDIYQITIKIDKRDF